jgi:hypothetical protein
MMMMHHMCCPVDVLFPPMGGSLEKQYRQARQSRWAGRRAGETIRSKAGVGKVVSSRPSVTRSRQVRPEPVERVVYNGPLERTDGENLPHNMEASEDSISVSGNEEDEPKPDD